MEVEEILVLLALEMEELHRPELVTMDREVLLHLQEAEVDPVLEQTEEPLQRVETRLRMTEALEALLSVEVPDLLAEAEAEAEGALLVMVVTVVTDQALLEDQTRELVASVVMAESLALQEGSEVLAETVELDRLQMPESSGMEATAAAVEMVTLSEAPAETAAHSHHSTTYHSEATAAAVATE